VPVSQHRRWRVRPAALTFGALSVVALGVTACTSPAAPTAGAPAAAAPAAGLMGGSCKPVEVIAARGTSEPQQSSIIMSGLGNGIAQQTGGSIYQVVYDAGFDYLNGPGQGASDALKHMQATSAACPTTKFVLAGYSEGAMVIVTLMGQLPADLGAKVSAAVLYGDPYYKSDSAAAAGSAKGSANGLIPIMGVPAAYAGKTKDFCDSGDPVCGGGANVLAHIGYGSHDAEGIAFAVSKVSGG
jgi:cutinase